MKKIVLDQTTCSHLIGRLRKLLERNESMVFPEYGLPVRNSKFGKVRRMLSTRPQRLTTYNVNVSPTEIGLRIFNPLNKGFGYGDVTIPYGTTIIIAYNSYFWRDPYGIWRQMTFSKNPGWALRLSQKRKVPFVANKQPVSRLEPHTLVKTTQENTSITDFEPGTRDACLWNSAGAIIRNDDYNGLKHLIRHADDSKAWYDASEILAN